MKTGAEDGGSGVSLLVCGTGGKTIGVPLTAVRETMRPLPLFPVPDIPTFVLGAARVRGATVPVLDSGLLTGGEPVAATRWITLAASNERTVALAVASVAGVRTLSPADLEALPPLLAGSGPQLFTAVAVRDQQLLLALEASHLVPDEVWARLAEVTSS